MRDATMEVIAQIEETQFIIDLFSHECPVCYTKHETERYCNNNHFICETCFNQIKSCPICRADYPFELTTKQRQEMEKLELLIRFSMGQEYLEIVKKIYTNNPDKCKNGYESQMLVMNTVLKHKRIAL